MKSKKSILEELESFSLYANYLDVLIHLAHKNLNCYVDELLTREPRDLLDTNEISHLFGYWIKNFNRRTKEKLDVHATGVIIEALMEQLHWSFLKKYPSINPNAENIEAEFEKRMTSSASLQETIFYSSGGVYDYQYASFSLSKYERDEEWLIDNMNIDLKSFLHFYTYIKSTLNYKLNYKSSMDSIESLKFYKQNYIFKKFPVFLKLLDQFSWDMQSDQNSSFSNIGDLNYFNQKPVLKFADYYLVPIPYLLSEALYESPFYWMLEDKSYEPTALKNRGIVAEGIVYKLLTHVFDEQNVFKNVLVRPNKTKTITDLDVCVLHGSTLIIFQVKSKKLIQSSKQGNVKTIKNDFKKAVSDAYDQSIKAYDPILIDNCMLVNNSHEEVFKSKNVSEILTVCIVLDNYPPISIHSKIFYDTKEITPIAVSIFQLDIFSKYLTTPDKFVDYISKRTYNSKYFFADSELSYLSHFLNNGMKKEENATQVALMSGLAQFFDEDFYMSLVREYEPLLGNYIHGIGRNNYCFCGSGLKYKKCCESILKG